MYVASLHDEIVQERKSHRGRDAAEDEVHETCIRRGGITEPRMNSSVALSYMFLVDSVRSYPNPIILNWYEPNGVENDVFSLSSSLMGMQWNAPIASKQEKMRDFPSLAKLALQSPIG